MELHHRSQSVKLFLSEPLGFTEQDAGGLRDAQFYEFGAGWDLAGPLALYCLGANRQILVDLAPCARLELVNGVIVELNRLGEAIPRRPGERLASLEDLDRRFGIKVTTRR